MGIFIKSQIAIKPFETKEWISEKDLSGITAINGKIFAGSPDGTIYRVNFKIPYLQPYKELHCPVIDLGALNDNLFVLCKDGLYSISEEKISSVVEPVSMLEGEKKLYILTQKSLIIFDGKRKKSYSLKSPPLDQQLIDGTLLILTKEILYSLEDNVAPKSFKLGGTITDYSIYSELKRRNLFDIDKDRGLVITLSSTKGKKFEVSLFDWRTTRKIWSKKFKEKVSALGFWNNRVFVFTNFTSSRMETKSHLYVYDLNGNPVISDFEFDYPVARAFRIEKKSLAVAGELKFFEVFYNDIQTRYSIDFPPSNSFIYKPIFKDIDGNGDKDLLCISYSNLPNKRLRSKWVSLLLLKKREALNNMLFNYRKALELERKLKIWKAIEYCEAAMEVGQFSTPEKMPEFLKTHRRILKKIIIWTYIKKGVPYFIAFLIFAILVYSLVKLSLKLKKKGNPPDFVMEKLSGSNFSHQALHLLKRLLNMDKKEFIPAFEQHREEFKRLLEYFTGFQPYFKKASLQWDETFKKVKKSLHKLLVGKVTKQKIQEAYDSIEELANMIRAMRGSVIENALKPAIKSILPMAEERGIKVEVDIQHSSTTFGTFYPEKLTEFRNAFHAILQNSIEAFEDYNPAGEEPTISISAEENLYNLLVVINDNGKGMDESTKELMFISGFSTKGKNRGYGLAEVKKLFEEWGTIEVDSAPGEGTTIKIQMEIKKLA